MCFKKGEIKSNIKKSREKHAYFVSLLEQAADAMPELNAAWEMLHDRQQLKTIREELVRLTPKPKPTDTATVWIDDINPLESNAWHDWWREFRQKLHEEHDPKGKPDDAGEMCCFLKGELITPAATHDKIKGLKNVGGLGMGDVVIGFDKASFQSYGLKKSANAAISEESAKTYVEALNRLIAEHSVKLGDALVTFWYSHSVPEDDDPFAYFKDPTTPEAGVETLPKKLLHSIQQGQRPDLLNNHYFALTLSGASGRVMVRRWMEGQFIDLLRNIDAWFSDLEIVARDGGIEQLARPPKFISVVACMENRRDRDTLEKILKRIPPPHMTQLWEAAISNGAIPYSAHAKALLRCRVDIIQDNPANHARMGLLKAWHIRNKGDRSMHPHLNTEHPSPAYQCGRLLAVLAKLQQAAHKKDVGAGVVQRYYTAASQTPALTLGRLISNSKNHLNKLEGGLQYWFEGQIAEVMGRIRDAIPRTLDLEQQSLFALGYYQQLAALRAGKAKDESTTDE